MASSHDEARASGKHATFHTGFIWAASTAALNAALPSRAHLTFVLGFGFPLGRGFASFVQTHGHVQLIGWAGLCVVGISVHSSHAWLASPLPGHPGSAASSGLWQRGLSCAV